MEKTKKFLNISIGISIILCSLSLLVFSVKQNTATAKPQPIPSFQPVGVAMYDKQYLVFGYNTSTLDVVVLGRITPAAITKQLDNFKGMGK